ncbi:transglutaminase-like domain-containing protein [Lacihabitans sp. CS3-21]|jgi:regulator of sirC expression with transglutaminase-like and TPR domain|uniref:transglutaminase-like domain-containing protein n=1 Tax=Lacihabitans sp. CS3-21 TaxID=2487332 RepID=UPI0020CFE087|nr:transglutaminase-like domain-containing protein [Lacihabitans sp. CS3-21]
MNREDLKAMISLLDDSDMEVVNIVENNIKNLGHEVIPILEKEWERNGLNPVLQKKIEDLVHDLHLSNLSADLESWKNNNHTDLMTGLWLIAKYQYPDLKVETLNQEIKNIQMKVWVNTHEKMHPNDMVKILNDVIFEQLKFEPNIKNFHSPSNSMFNLVLSQKKGNPVALSCLFILLAQRLDLPIYGVNLPNLFVLIFDYPGYRFYLNPFNRGQVFLEKDIDDYLKQMNIEPNEKYYKSCSNIEIIKRVLTNLSFAYQKIGEEDKQNEVNQFLKIFD